MYSMLNRNLLINHQADDPPDDIEDQVQLENWNRGYYARINNQLKNSNPFPETEQGFDSWESGWFEADENLKKKA